MDCAKQMRYSTPGVAAFQIQWEYYHLSLLAQIYCGTVSQLCLLLSEGWLLCSRSLPCCAQPQPFILSITGPISMDTESLLWFFSWFFYFSISCVLLKTSVQYTFILAASHDFVLLRHIGQNLDFSLVSPSFCTALIY